MGSRTLEVVGTPSCVSTVSDDVCTLEPGSNVGVGAQTLTISRTNGELYLAPARATSATPRAIRALFGLVRLNSGFHLIAVTQATRTGAIAGNEVFKVTATEIIPIGPARPRLSAQQADDDRTYIAMLREVTNTGAFYFSYTYDLTRSQQSQAKLAVAPDTPLYKRADDRFFWNRYLLESLIDKSDKEAGSGFASFIVPIVHAFVEVRQVELKKAKFDYVLLTRRSCRRAGTRYHTRGIDLDGNVANFNETEQIIVFQDKSIASYLQIRGSVPLFWRQIINLKYKPHLEADVDETSLQAFRSHFQELFGLYGDQIVFSLIDGKGYETKVGNAFDNIVKRADDRRIRRACVVCNCGPVDPRASCSYSPFDFHKECKGMRYDRLQKLLDGVNDQLKAQGYFFKDANGVVRSTQKSIVRTNCMDCLDRTNVVQSMLARRFLNDQLTAAKILEGDEQISAHPAFERLFRNGITDLRVHEAQPVDGVAFYVSSTGKRTRQGAVQDGINSAVRYIRNNFMDGYRQDAIDLLLGNYRVQPGDESPFATNENVNTSVRKRTLPLLIGLSFVMLIATLALPAENVYLSVLYIVFWAATLAWSLRYIVTHGTDFVNRPRLFNPVNGRNRPAVANY